MSITSENSYKNTDFNLHVTFIAVCSELAIENGMISYAVDMEAPFELATLATYNCNPDYRLELNSGTERRTCEDDGNGSGGVFTGVVPTCVCKLYIHNLS